MTKVHRTYSGKAKWIRKVINADFCHVDEAPKSSVVGIRANSKASESAYVSLLASSYIPDEVRTLREVLYYIHSRGNPQVSLYESLILCQLTTFDEACKSAIMECYKRDDLRPWGRTNKILLDFVINKYPLHVSLGSYADFIRSEILRPSPSLVPSDMDPWRTSFCMNRELTSPFTVIPGSEFGARFDFINFAILSLSTGHLYGIRVTTNITAHDNVDKQWKDIRNRDHVLYLSP